MRLGKQRLFIVALSFLVVVFTLVGRLVGDDRQREKTYSDLATFTEVLHLVDTSYVDPVEEERLMSGAFRGLLSSLDPHSGWLSPDEVREIMDDEQVRIHAGIECTKRGGYGYVASVRQDSPAARAGVEAGDYIRTINGRSTRDMSILQVRHALTGPPSSTLNLNLFGGHEGKEAEIVLVPYEPRPVTVTSHEGGILLLKVNYLAEETLEAVRSTLADPDEGTSQVLLDLRDTVGGGRAEGTALADLFMNGGTIVRIEARGQEPEDVMARPDAVWEGPLALLVNRLSAGAVEIAVAGLKESQRAEVLGESTFGDASLQKLIRLPDESALILSVGRYVASGGASWNGKGIDPDVRISSRAAVEPATEPEADAVDADDVGPDATAEEGEAQAEGEGEDLQLERALEYLVETRSGEKKAA
jgi:carboxyl-terminal processing protease